MDINEKLTETAPGSLDITSLEVMEDPFSQVKITVPRRRDEKLLAQKARKRRSLRYRKRYTRKKGTVHPKKKEATRNRQLRERWATDAFWCVCYGYGAHQMDREKWDKYIAPFWEVYLPSELKVKWYDRYGTREKPYTVYSMDLLYCPEGQKPVVLYNGNNQELYDLSSL